MLPSPAHTLRASARLDLRNHLGNFRPSAGLRQHGCKPATDDSPFATFEKFPHVVAIVHRPSQADPRILESCDAFVASLDGAAGVDPKIVEFWSNARDVTLPRHILAFNVVNGRADFDELCAIAVAYLNQIY
jgi:hypothetical protein